MGDGDGSVSIWRGDGRWRVMLEFTYYRREIWGLWHCETGTNIDRRVYNTRGIFCMTCCLNSRAMVCSGCLAAVKICRCHDGGVDYGICRSTLPRKIDNNIVWFFMISMK